VFIRSPSWPPAFMALAHYWILALSMVEPSRDRRINILGRRQHKSWSYRQLRSFKPLATPGQPQQPDAQDDLNAGRRRIEPGRQTRRPFTGSEKIKRLIKVGRAAAGEKPPARK